MNEILLELLKDARKNQRSKINNDIDFPALYNMSKEHQISALIYNQIYSFPGLPDDLKEIWKREALKINAFQTRRTIRMLQIYRKFLEKDLKVLIVKGLICRSLYPQPDNRNSNDEDLYVRDKDMGAVSEIFIENNFQVISKKEDVTTFIDPMSGLSIELHTALFSMESKAYGNYQKYFEDAFDKCIRHNIDGVDVYSLNYDQHLLFLILHLVKHFFHGGVGIRQLLDIVMYSEAYGEKIDWDKLYQILKELNIYTLVINLIALAHDHLELDYTKIKVPEDIKDTDYEDLLKDIMEAGVFGQSSNERIHSATMTLNTISDGKTNVLKSIFPPMKEMKGKYEYLDKYPILLPVAYISRIVNYKKNHSSSESQKTIEVGKQRVELLRKYKVIK